MTIAWRICFVVFAVLIAAGGPQHPKGTMEQMLADPKWVPAHSLMLAGFVALLIGLILFGRGHALPPRTRRWLRWAVAGAIAQVVEMALHTAAVVDAANLVAHRSTPVLTTHLSFAVVAYPFFAATLIGFIVTTAKEHALGSPWIAPVGILGAVAHGASAPLVVAFNVQGAASLFPLLMLIALWALVAAFWPVHAAVSEVPSPNMA
jgi:alkylhydroperoxidase/carboxymuconolactone decarboxylase family protein YurZ